MAELKVGFAVLYRWRLRAGAEESFIAAWTRITELLRDQRGGLGSRLHRGPEGIWYAYAQWPSAEARQAAFAGASVDAGASQQLHAAIAEALPEIVLEPVADLLVLPAPPQLG